MICSVAAGPFQGSPRVQGVLRMLVLLGAGPLRAWPELAVLQVIRERRAHARADLLPK